MQSCSTCQASTTTSTSQALNENQFVFLFLRASLYVWKINIGNASVWKEGVRVFIVFSYIEMSGRKRKNWSKSAQANAALYSIGHGRAGSLRWVERVWGSFWWVGMGWLEAVHLLWQFHFEQVWFSSQLEYWRCEFCCPDGFLFFTFWQMQGWEPDFFVCLEYARLFGQVGPMLSFIF